MHLRTCTDALDASNVGAIHYDLKRASIISTPNQCTKRAAPEKTKRGGQQHTTALAFQPVSNRPFCALQLRKHLNLSFVLFYLFSELLLNSFSWEVDPLPSLWKVAIRQASWIQHSRWHNRHSSDRVFSSNGLSNIRLPHSTSSLLLVAMPGAPSSFLLLVVRPGAPSSVLAPIQKCSTRMTTRSRYHSS